MAAMFGWFKRGEDFGFALKPREPIGVGSNATAAES